MLYNQFVKETTGNKLQKSHSTCKIQYAWLPWKYSQLSTAN